MYNLFIAIIILLLLSGCSADERDGKSVVPLTEGSTDGLLTEEELSDLEAEDEHEHKSSDEKVQENPISPDQPNLTSDMNNEHELPQHNQDSLQQMIPEEQKPLDSSFTSTHLPFFDFKERWNSISDNQFSNLYIRSLEKGTEEGHFLTNLGLNLELHVYVQEDHIQRLEMKSNDRTEITNMQMLTGWNQIINIMHPTIDIYDVDSLFHKIGVGPNADLSKVKYVRFTYSQIGYEVQPTSTGYTFQAFYHSN